MRPKLRCFYILPCLTALLLSACSDDDSGQNTNQNNNNNYTTAICGNGIREGEEECDDGDENSDVAADACRTDCREARCGDGVIDSNEQCDDGAQNSDTEPDACRTTCLEPVCGDGVIDTEHEETCDDGNTEGGDGCGPTCVSETCGDGHKDPGEACDDGNNVDCDGCRGNCTAQESGCGDGFVCGSEECDDGANGDPCDGCLDDCSAYTNICGDGFVCGVEVCDDANNEDCDGCCGDCSRADNVCGDGIVECGEACDSGTGGETCVSLAPMYGGGSLSCTGECQWDTSSCTGGADLTWITILGGAFDMGSTSGASNETPVHTVNVPDFQMTKTEVTVAQYEECVTAGGCTSPSSGGHCNWNDPGYENHPVNCVEWFEAEDFCMWAGGRLPTEAEWEYAARSGGQDITYPWGDETATCTYAVMGEDMQGYYDDGCGTLRTMIVCSKTLGNTVQGLCDMAGNVYEWVQDWYHSDYNGAPVDGSAWLEDPDPYYDRVIRGGSQEEPADKLRAADRSYIDPSYNYCDIKTIGFRCAR